MSRKYVYLKHIVQSYDQLIVRGVRQEQFEQSIFEQIITTIGNVLYNTIQQLSFQIDFFDGARRFVRFTYCLFLDD